MEQWRRELYHSELYHYGVKGMKWGKHLKSKIRDFYNLRITGNDYLEPRARYETHNSNYGYSNSYQYHKDRAASGQYLANKWRDLSRDRSYSYPKSALRQARAENIYSRKHEKQANQLLQNYYTKSLKGIAESKVKKAQKWIKSKINKKTDLHAVRPRNDGTIPETFIKEKYVREKYS